MGWFNGGTWTGLTVNDVADLLFECARALNEREAAMDMTLTSFKTFGADHTNPTRVQLVGIEMNGSKMLTNLTALQDGVTSLCIGTSTRKFMVSGTSTTEMSISVLLNLGGISASWKTLDRVQTADIWNQFREAFDDLIFIKYHVPINRSEVGTGTESNFQASGPPTVYPNALENAWDARGDNATDNDLDTNYHDASTDGAPWKNGVVYNRGPHVAWTGAEKDQGSPNVIAWVMSEQPMTMQTNGLLEGVSTKGIITLVFYVHPEYKAALGDWEASAGANSFAGDAGDFSGFGTVTEVSHTYTVGADTAGLTLAVDSTEPNGGAADFPWDNAGAGDHDYHNFLMYSTTPFHQAAWCDISSILSDQ